MSTQAETNRTMKLEPPRFEEGRPMLIAGFREFHPFGKMQNIGAQWQRFMQSVHTIPNRAGNATFGLCFLAEEGCDYMTGIEVKGDSDLPPEFSRLRMPAQRYAVFSHHYDVSKLQQTVESIWKEWYPASGHRIADSDPALPNFFERYGEDFNPETLSGGIEVWVPLAE